MHHLNRRQRSGSTHQRLASPLGLHGHEGQHALRLSWLAKQKGAWSVSLFGLFKPSIHCGHQGLGRTVVRVQHVMAPDSRTTCCHVAVNVRPPKTVDGLLGVPDQEQGTVPCMVGRAVNLIKDPVLQGRGVLELVEHGHGILIQHALAQRLAVRARQGCIQPVQHVCKTKCAGLLLQVGQALSHPRRCVQPDRCAHLGKIRQITQQLLKGFKMIRHVDAASRRLASLQQAVRTQTMTCCGRESMLLQFRVSGPGCQFAQPPLIVARCQLSAIPIALLGRRLSIQPLAHGLRPLRPPSLERVQPILALLLALTQARRQAAAPCFRGQYLLMQSAHVADQGRHVLPNIQNH